MDSIILSESEQKILNISREVTKGCLSRLKHGWGKENLFEEYMDNLTSSQMGIVFFKDNWFIKNRGYFLWTGVYCLKGTAEDFHFFVMNHETSPLDSKELKKVLDLQYAKGESNRNWVWHTPFEKPYKNWLFLENKKPADLVNYISHSVGAIGKIVQTLLKKNGKGFSA